MVPYSLNPLREKWTKAVVIPELGFLSFRSICLSTHPSSKSISPHRAGHWRYRSTQSLCCQVWVYCEGFAVNRAVVYVLPSWKTSCCTSRLLVFTRKTHHENDIYFIASFYWLERQTYSGYKNNHILTNNTLLLQYWILSGGCNYNTTLNNILIMGLTQSTRG